MRRVIAALIVVGLAVAVVLLWPRAASEEPSEIVAGPTTTTSTTSTTEADPTTTTRPTTTSTLAADGSHVVETVEEAEAILANHYYKWFEGIFTEDEELIRSTVFLDTQVQAAVNQFGTMEFSGEPSLDGLQFTDIEVLRADRQCLAVWSVASASFRPGVSEGVAVFRWSGAEWKLLGTWQSKDDLWEADCESSLPS